MWKEIRVERDRERERKVIIEERERERLCCSVKSDFVTEKKAEKKK